MGDYLTSCRKADRQGSPHRGSALMHDEPLLEQDVVREPTEGSLPPPDDRCWSRTSGGACQLRADTATTLSRALVPRKGRVVAPDKMMSRATRIGCSRTRCLPDLD